MWKKVNIYTYKDKAKDAVLSTTISQEQRNILDFDLEFNSSKYGQYDLAEEKINAVKFELAALLSEKFTFYEFKSDYLNSKKSKLPTKTRTDDLSFISKTYTIPEATISFRAEEVKYSLEKYKDVNPNLVYCHKRTDLLTEDILNSYVVSKLEVVFNGTDFNFYKKLGCDLMLISFIGWEKVRIIELEKVDIEILKKCLDIMLFHERVNV